MEGAPHPLRRCASAAGNNEESRLNPAFDDNVREVATALARAFLSGDAEAKAMQQRGTRALGRGWPWLKKLVREVLFDFGPPLRPEDHDEIANRIAAQPEFRAAFEAGEEIPAVHGHFPFHPSMREPALPGLSLPRLDTPGDLAAWLNLTPAELDWFADPAGWGSRSGSAKLLHYDYRWLRKASGAPRLIEAPKSRLREIQRHVLRDILDRVPCHGAAHGSVTGRSAITNAQAHVGRPIVVRLDLADFFTSVRSARVHALFASLGYPPETARYLTGLTTHCTPPSVVRSVPQEEHASPESLRELRVRTRCLLGRHLPQGAPTSPALANLCSYRLDLRLAGAARASGARYTRYVDDLVFSCDSPSQSRARRLAQMAYAIVLEEGFAPNTRKTRILSRSCAQRVTGLVVNERINLPRRDYERLKAVLTNCVRHGPASQNREGHGDFRAHLLGRLSQLAQINAARGARLMALFEQIRWS